MTVTSGQDASAPFGPPVGELRRDTPESSGDVPAGADVPSRADDLELFGEISGSGYRKAPSLVRRGDGQTVQLTRLLYVVLDNIDGQRDCEEIAARVSEAYGRDVSAEDVRGLIHTKLRPLGLLRKADGTQPEVKKTNPLLALRFRYVVSDPQKTRRITAPFAALFHPLIIAPVVVGFVLICAWTLFEKGLASAAYNAFDRPHLLLAVFALTVLSAGFHEFGHAAAARYGGATPGAMGAGLYLVWPAFYTDVTDSYRLGRGGRIRTDLGGLYFNMIFATAMFGIWWVTGWEAMLLIVPAQLLQMLQQLTPLMRFDGYHLLADITGVPDMYQRIKPTLLGLLPNHWGDPESKVLRPWARAVVTLWVLLIVPILLFSLVMLVLTMPRLIATAGKSLGDQWNRLSDAFGDADVVGTAVGLLSILAVIIPLAGVAYIVVRLVQKATAKVWRATDDRPGRRAAAHVTALAIIAGLVWAWWPQGDNYRPLQAWERGTVADGFAAVGDDPPRGIEEGRGGEAQSIWRVEEGRELPTRDRPMLAMVLVPVSDEDAPTWVFPFDRPMPPGEGDNQALAVNTTDGTVVYEVAFALVWAKDGSILNSNEAYAFASCKQCASVAIGFQIIIAVGEVNVAIPENIAGAVNYACVSCVTFALAKQLVITLPKDLSPEAMAQLETLWGEIRQFGENIRGVPLSELQSRLEQFEQRILAIVEQEGAPAPAPTADTVAPDTTASPTTVGATEAPAPAPAPPPEPSATVGPTDPPADQTTVTPAPTTQPAADAPASTPAPRPTTATTKPPAGTSAPAPATTSAPTTDTPTATNAPTTTPQTTSAPETTNAPETTPVTTAP